MHDFNCIFLFIKCNLNCTILNFIFEKFKNITPTYSLHNIKLQMYRVFHLLQSDLWETITGENLLLHKVSSVKSVKCKQIKIIIKKLL